jgi:hypothetical protein
MQILRAGVFYFALVFGAGFVLGTIRTLWVVPRVGTRTNKFFRSRFPSSEPHCKQERRVA